MWLNHFLEVDCKFCSNLASEHGNINTHMLIYVHDLYHSLDEPRELLGETQFLLILMIDTILKKSACWDFPGGPVAKNLHTQRRGARFKPWSGN